MNQKSPNDPKSILILTMKLLLTYFWKRLPIGDLISLTLILLAFSKSSQIGPFSSNHLKSGCQTGKTFGINLLYNQTVCSFPILSVTNHLVFLTWVHTCHHHENSGEPENIARLHLSWEGTSPASVRTGVCVSVCGCAKLVHWRKCALYHWKWSVHDSSDVIQIKISWITEELWYDHQYQSILHRKKRLGSTWRSVASVERIRFRTQTQEAFSTPAAHTHTHTHTHTHRMTSLITRTAPGSSCASWVQKPASRTLWSIHCCFQVKDNIDAQKTFQNKKRICNMFSECVRQCLLRAKFYSVPRKLYLCSCNASHVLQCASCFTQFSIKPTHQQHAQDCLLYLQCTTQITVCHTFCSVALQKSLFFIFCCKHQSHKPQRIQI